MNTQEYQKIQALRKNLHEAQKSENKNESSTDNITKINEQLVEAGCGTQQINE